jgi:ubiquinone/menaquinone biosynthesis C-methylase UbiE
MSTSTREEDRIRLAYHKRTDDEAVYSFFNPGHLFIAQQLQREMIKVFQRHEISPLSNKRILEVGCGTGGRLRELVNYGAQPVNLCGIDLLPNAIEEAKATAPNMDFRHGNAEALPFEDKSFDILLQFTMFTSILDVKMKQNTAKEMLRVLKPSGIILWYDYFVSKPNNPDVKAIGKREIINLFANCTFDFDKVTLAPPIARALAPYSFLLCYLLEKIPFLRTHYLVVIKKKLVQNLTAETQSSTLRLPSV